MRRAATPPEVLAAFDTRAEPTHLPHMNNAPNLTDAGRDPATLSLPDLLLQTGVLTGPYRNPHPITRWRLIGRRISTALAALARAL
jgi:hypothetical protein